MPDVDLRRSIPRTDQLLALPQLQQARSRLGRRMLRTLLRNVLQRARQGDLALEDVENEVLVGLTELMASSLRPVVNATGVVVHTNLGRAPLSRAAVEALIAACGYVDVELDLTTGTRSRRGTAAVAALLACCPVAEDALVVNNGAAALCLATTTLAVGRSVVVSQGELVEIGASFRLPDLIASTGTLTQIGTTNRTHLADYAAAVDKDTGCILKVHPSNFRVEGFTSAVSLRELRTLADDRHVPLVVDLGSGLLTRDPMLPDEPDATTALADGADLVIMSGDKLLGGPQAGVILGKTDVVAALARHPLARAFRADKLTLAALEATLLGGPPPVVEALHADPERLRQRARYVADAVGAPVVPHEGRVGGGGAPGVALPGWAVKLPAEAAPRLRAGDPPVLARVHDGVCLVDLRCVPESEDERLLAAVRAAVTTERTD